MPCCATVLIVLPTWLVLVPTSWSLDAKWYCCHVLDIKPDVAVSGMFKTYYKKPKKNLSYLYPRLQMFRSERNDFMNRSKTQVGQLVYKYHTKETIVYTGSRKMVCYFVGPLVIYRPFGPNQFLQMSLTGQIYPFLVVGNKTQTMCYIDY